MKKLPDYVTVKNLMTSYETCMQAYPDHDKQDKVEEYEPEINFEA